MYVAILSSVLTFIATTYLLVSFDSEVRDFQFVERYHWIDSIGLEFYVGVDGLSIYFIFLSALLTLICIIASLFTIKKNVKEFLLCFLLLESFCIGAFSSLNLLLFYMTLYSLDIKVSCIHSCMCMYTCITSYYR